MSISHAALQAMQFRLAQNRKPIGNVTLEASPPALVESELHEEIRAYCRARQWVCVTSRMDRRTTQQPGVADFIITMPVNRTIYVEAKAKGGKLRIEQQAFKCLVEHNGGEFFLAYNMEQFLEAIKAK